MKKRLLTAIFTILALSGRANAANVAMIASPPTLFSFFVLVIAGFCLFSSFQVLSQVKGGMLSRSWQMFFLGFLLLAVSQLASILSAMEFISLPAYFTPLMLVLMAGVFAYGVYNARKTLS